MGRLIDEDILVKYIDKHTHDQNALDDDIACILEEMPTAFDVDAVVKEIQRIGTSFCVHVHCKNECENCDHGSIMKNIIKVVRNGGVE